MKRSKQFPANDLVFVDRQTGRHTCGEASRIDPPNLESAWLAQQNAERIAEHALSVARNS